MVAHQIKIPDMLNKKPEYFLYNDSLPAIYAKHFIGLHLNGAQIDRLVPDDRPMTDTQNYEEIQ